MAKAGRPERNRCHNAFDGGMWPGNFCAKILGVSIFIRILTGVHTETGSAGRSRKIRNLRRALITSAQMCALLPEALRPKSYSLPSPQPGRSPWPMVGRPAAW
jgi:hypothetical protein